MLRELAFLYSASAISNDRVRLVSHLRRVEADSEPHIRRTYKGDCSGGAVVSDGGVDQFAQVT